MSQSDQAILLHPTSETVQYVGLLRSSHDRAGVVHDFIWLYHSNILWWFVSFYHETGGSYAKSEPFQNIIFQQLAIDENSYSYGLWVETPIDMYMKVYYFDCVNAEEVMASNVKPL